MAGRSRPNRINIRKTHPGLYHSLMIISVGKLALAVNFWFSHPTFNPYGISKNLIGFVFAGLGVSQLAFLNVFRDLRMVRRVLATAISFLVFWGVSNSQQFFQGKASLQLPILYVVLALIQIPLLLEPPVNPITDKS